MLSRSSEVETPLYPDPLSEVLRDLHLGEVSSGYGELAHPWGIAFSSEEVARFHFVVSGACWISAPGHDGIAMRAGDAVLLPHGTGHTLCSTKRGATEPYEKVESDYIGRNTSRLRGGGDGQISVLFCCSVVFRDPAVRPLLELMPAFLLLRSAAQHDPALPVLLETMAGEVRAQRMGSATVLSRLADVVIARVIRAWAEEHVNDTTGWLAAVHDPKIGRAIAAIHREPGGDWSVEALAGIACVSRSVFTERFVELVGVPPARYVTRLRMQIACGWLRSDHASVARVSERLGYESEASFSRAFRRHVGLSPSEVRRSGRTEKSARLGSPATLQPRGASLGQHARWRQSAVPDEQQ